MGPWPDTDAIKFGDDSDHCQVFFNIGKLGTFCHWLITLEIVTAPGNKKLEYAPLSSPNRATLSGSQDSSESKEQKTKLLIGVNFIQLPYSTNRDTNKQPPPLCS